MIQLVRTDKGYVAGTVIGEPDNPVTIFRGIPYAAPPVGERRWKAPQPAKAWTGIRECTQYFNMSPQAGIPGQPFTQPLSEDCLYLNVVTPAKKDNDRLPVMVWFHGGGYFAGSGNDVIWNSPRLALNGVVIVTVVQRLGPLGLAAHTLLSKESPHGVSGNYLFLDLIESLKWVRTNIAAFGGNPGNVTIFGESGGGAKVSVMMASPLAKGLFHSAICESGTACVFDKGKTLAELEKSGVTLFEKLGVSTLEEARKVPWEKILAASQTMETAPLPGRTMPQPAWDAAFDGWLLPLSPEEAFIKGAVNAVPFMACANLGELTGPGGLTMPVIVPAYVRMMEGVKKHNINTYAAIFDQVPANWRKEGGNAAHALELPYVFGDWDNTTGWWETLAPLMQVNGVKSPAPELGKDDRFISESMMRMWAQFARTGKPSVNSLIDWPAWDQASDRYIYFNRNLEVKTGFSRIAQ